MRSFLADCGRLRCAIVFVAIAIRPGLTVNCEEQPAAGHAGSAEASLTSTPMEDALNELRLRFPNRVVLGFEELFDPRQGSEAQTDLCPNGTSLEEVLNCIRKVDPRYSIKLLKGGMVHVYPAKQTADPVGLLDIRLREFSMPQDSCLGQAIRSIGERGYAPELGRYLAERKTRWYRSHRRQIPGSVGDILGDCYGLAAPGPAYRDITVREALDLMAERSLQVSRGELTSNSPVHPTHKPISWRFRFRRDPDSDTGLGGIPVFETF